MSKNLHSKTNKIIATFADKLPATKKLAKDLMEIPIKDKGVDQVHFQVFRPNESHQVDLLYTTWDPNDVIHTSTSGAGVEIEEQEVEEETSSSSKRPFKYILVAVDLATGKTDAEPLRTHSSEEVRDALLIIYKRGILQRPKWVEADSGSEFKGVFREEFDRNGTTVRYKLSGRSRSQAVVENRNWIISKVLGTLQLENEIEKNEIDNIWVELLPSIIKEINKHYAHAPISKHKLIEGEPLCKKDTCNLLMEGDEVRVILDKPTGYLEGERLKGKFRIGDIRWNKTPTKITNVILKPNNPPLYEVAKPKGVWYTKQQLQLVKLNENLN